MSWWVTCPPSRLWGRTWAGRACYRRESRQREYWWTPDALSSPVLFLGPRRGMGAGHWAGVESCRGVFSETPSVVDDWGSAG